MELNYAMIANNGNSCGTIGNKKALTNAGLEILLGIDGELVHQAGTKCGALGSAV